MRLRLAKMNWLKMVLEKKSFKCFVAEFESKVVGMALFYPRYSTWKGNVLHLEDLIVTKNLEEKALDMLCFQSL